MRYSRSFLHCLAFIVFLAGCGSPSIREIMREPEKHRDEKVKLSGQVTGLMTHPKSGASFFQLDDGSSEIWVLAEKSPPQVGQESTIKGTVRVGVNIGGISFQAVVIPDGMGNQAEDSSAPPKKP